MKLYLFDFMVFVNSELVNRGRAGVEEETMEKAIDKLTADLAEQLRLVGLEHTLEIGLRTVVINKSSLIVKPGN